MKYSKLLLLVLCYQLKAGDSDSFYNVEQSEACSTNPEEVKITSNNVAYDGDLTSDQNISEKQIEESFDDQEALENKSFSVQTGKDPILTISGQEQEERNLAIDIQASLDQNNTNQAASSSNSPLVSSPTNAINSINLVNKSTNSTLKESLGSMSNGNPIVGESAILTSANVGAISNLVDRGPSPIAHSVSESKVSGSVAYGDGFSALSVVGQQARRRERMNQQEAMAREDIYEDDLEGFQILFSDFCHNLNDLRKEEFYDEEDIVRVNLKRGLFSEFMSIHDNLIKKEEYSFNVAKLVRGEITAREVMNSDLKDFFKLHKNIKLLSGSFSNSEKCMNQGSLVKRSSMLITLRRMGTLESLQESEWEALTTKMQNIYIPAMLMDSHNEHMKKDETIAKLHSQLIDQGIKSENAIEELKNQLDAQKLKSENDVNNISEKLNKLESLVNGEISQLTKTMKLKLKSIQEQLNDHEYCLDIRSEADSVLSRLHFGDNKGPNYIPITNYTEYLMHNVERKDDNMSNLISQFFNKEGETSKCWVIRGDDENTRKIKYINKMCSIFTKAHLAKNKGKPLHNTLHDLCDRRNF